MNNPNDGLFALRWFCILIIAWALRELAGVNTFITIGAYLVWRGYRHLSYRRWEAAQLYEQNCFYQEEQADDLR